MEYKLLQKQTKKNCLYLIDNAEKISQIKEINENETGFILQSFEEDKNLVTINKYGSFVFIYLLKAKASDSLTRETCRKTGAEVQGLCNKHKLADIVLVNYTALDFAAMMVAEGIGLANYQFLKYFSEPEKKENTLDTVYFSKDSATLKNIAYLNIVTAAIYKVRDLVNEPQNFLTAKRLSVEIELLGKEADFDVTVLNKEKIAKAKMGGLLAVNKGSIEPPTFTIMEYKPKKSLNKKPIVLIGKGIVFDTGGLSLKPTLNSMDKMKSDMSGAALVSGAMYAISLLKLPLHVIALVPATDNRPGENAYAPGDVIKMGSGKTVEVLNTDAEGRMILADALHYAKNYEPELVLDFATLTGAASAAIGEHGIVCMGTADDEVKQNFVAGGYRQYERLVEFPLWDEYGEQIKSDIADIKNVGGSTGGAITAGKFLEHFIDYPWMHFDIAGVSLASSKKGYIPVGGTAFGLRMLIDFLTHYGKA